MNKTQKILNHLRINGSITSWEAIQEYGVTRLSAIIFNLRKRGMFIISERVTFTDRYGDKANFAKYVLISE